MIATMEPPLVAGRMPDEELYYFDEAAADRACSFFSKYLMHLDGEFNGQPFELLDWQRDEIIRPLFGWKKKADDLRMIRTVYCEVPKKNGKSALCSGLGLLLLSDDDEARAQVFCVAADTDQARIVFDAAKQMVLRSPVLTSFLGPWRSSIVDDRHGGSFRVLSADADTKHGLNIHGLIIDEYHVVNRKLRDTLVQGVAARRQPVVFYITTAGYDRESVCWEEREYALQVLNGTVDDPTYLPVIYTTEEGDAWDSIETAKKVNPSFGVTVKEDFFRQEIARAKASPAHETTYKWLHLNQWTQSVSQWISLDAWDKCRDEFTKEEMRGRLCYGGLDLGAVSDLTAFLLGLPDPDDQEIVSLLCWAWCPEARLEAADNRYRHLYRQWVRDGWLHTTPGEVTDYAFVRHQINDVATHYKLGDMAVDRLFQANQLMLELIDDGIDVVAMGQGHMSMAAPTREFEERVRRGKIRHNGNPLLRWALDNVAIRFDPSGNMKPDKKESQGKIDPIVAAVMALDRCMRNENGPSRYETEGLLFV